MKRRITTMIFACLFAIGCSKVEHSETVSTVEPAVSAPASIVSATKKVERATEPPPSRKRTPIPDDYIKLPKGKSSAGWQPEKYIELLCDPKAHRLSININPPEFRPNSGFPERRMLKISDFIFAHEKYSEDFAFHGPLNKFETCGVFVLKITGDMFNFHRNGRDGAHDAFVAVRLIIGKRSYFMETYRHPGYDGIRLSGDWPYAGRVEFDEDGCPTYHASRIDFSYDPEQSKVRLDKFVGMNGRSEKIFRGNFEGQDSSICNESFFEEATLQSIMSSRKAGSN